MTAFANVGVALLPALAFLAALVALDSYKLVRLRAILAVLLGGTLSAGAAYHANGALLALTGLDWPTYSRYLAPLVEELLKGAVVLLLIRLGRVGFLVDAAIQGFAVGAGFALIENAVYFMLLSGEEASLGLWIIRGFGTAIMHGGVTAILAVTALQVLDRQGALRSVGAVLPALVLAWVIHSVYNHGWLPPAAQTLAVLIGVPALLWAVFQHSERALGDWLGRGFDHDAALLEQIHSGRFTATPLGQYLTASRTRFSGPVVADLLCYVRLHTELALRAKGMLLMRANGFEVPADQASRDKFEELRYLEGAIGRTGLLAIRPMLHFSLKDLRQLYLIQ